MRSDCDHMPSCVSYSVCVIEQREAVGFGNRRNRSKTGLVFLCNAYKEFTFLRLTFLRNKSNHESIWEYFLYMYVWDQFVRLFLSDGEPGIWGKNLATDDKKNITWSFFPVLLLPRVPVLGRQSWNMIWSIYCCWSSSILRFWDAFLLSAYVKSGYSSYCRVYSNQSRRGLVDLCAGTGRQKEDSPGQETWTGCHSITGPHRNNHSHSQSS